MILVVIKKSMVVKYLRDFTDFGDYSKKNMAVKPKQISVILVIIEKKYGGEKQTDFGGSVAIKKRVRSSVQSLLFVPKLNYSSVTEEQVAT